MKRTIMYTFMLIICLLGGRIFANPVALPPVVMCMPHSLAVLYLGVGGCLGELTLFFNLNSTSVSAFDFENFSNKSLLFGIPAGLLFSDNGLLFYISKPQTVHRFGEFFPALEIISELGISESPAYIYSLLLRLKYPVILFEIKGKPFFAVSPFLEAGYCPPLNSLAAGAGFFLQFHFIAICGKYRMYLNPITGDIEQNAGCVFSLDLMHLVYQRSQ